MAKEVSNLIVEGMTDSHCGDCIRKTIERLNGVDSVNVSLQLKKVTVEYDPERITFQLIRDVIEDQGYSVS